MRTQILSFRPGMKLAVVMIVSTVVGCGGGDVGDKFKGERGSVSGKIVYAGKPVPANTQILFQSKEGGYSAGGKTDDKGEYKLIYNGKPLMPAVTYKIQLTPPPGAAANTSDPSKIGTMDPNVPAAVPESPPPPFPAKYNSIATSGLEKTLKGGANEINLDLTE